MRNKQNIVLAYFKRNKNKTFYTIQNCDYYCFIQDYKNPFSKILDNAYIIFETFTKTKMQGWDYFGQELEEIMEISSAKRKIPKLR